MKTGIFPGSFNPPTNAHFEIGNLLYQKGLLDKIIYIPVNNSNKKLLPLSKRIDMLKKSISSKYFEISDIMMNYNCNFNYQILKKLEQDQNDLYIIMGSDLLKEFMKFDNYQEMLFKYYFIIIPRFDINIELLIQKYYKEFASKFIILDYHNKISSSLVKQNINNDKIIKEMLDDKVFNYIKENNLYKDE